MSHCPPLLIALPLLVTAVIPAARAADPCAAFSIDVRHERMLFLEPPQDLVAGKTVAAGPLLAVDHLYRLRLSAQSEVRFALPPRKPTSSRQAYAGLARLLLEKPGIFRIAVDRPVSVAVVAKGVRIQPRNSEERPGCQAPHSIVEFALPARTPLTLEFSGGSVGTLAVSVSRSPDHGG